MQLKQSNNTRMNTSSRIQDIAYLPVEFHEDKFPS